MSHLKLIEAVSCVDGLYCCLFGEENYTRWKKLKDNVNMSSGTESDFVRWILDYIDGHLETADTVSSRFPANLSDLGAAVTSYNIKEEVVLLDNDTDSNDKIQNYPLVNGKDSFLSNENPPLHSNTAEVTRKAVHNKRKLNTPSQKLKVNLVEEVNIEQRNKSDELQSGHDAYNKYIGEVDEKNDTFCDDFLNSDLIIDEDVDWAGERATSPIINTEEDNASAVRSGLVGSPKTRQYLCEICYTSFPAYKDLLTHQTAAHGKDNTEKCRFCHKSFSHRVIRLKHEKLAHSLRTYPCDMCSKMFFEKASVTRHKKAKHSLIRFQCKICEQSFTQVGNLRRHERRMHNVIIC